MKKGKHKPVSEAQERIDALRATLHELYEREERTGSTVARIDEIAREIAELQEEKDGRGD